MGKTPFELLYRRIQITKMSRFFVGRPRVNKPDLENLRRKESEACEYANMRRGAEEKRLSPGELIRARLQSGKLSEQIKVVECFRTSVKLDDGMIWPLRTIAKARASFRRERSVVANGV